MERGNSTSEYASSTMRTASFIVFVMMTIVSLRASVLDVTMFLPMSIPRMIPPATPGTKRSKHMREKALISLLGEVCTA
eukprot:gene22336-28440_t